MDRQSIPGGHDQPSGPHHGFDWGLNGHGCEYGSGCEGESGLGHRVNAHENECVNENEHAAVASIDLGCAHGSLNLHAHCYLAFLHALIQNGGLLGQPSIPKLMKNSCTVVVFRLPPAIETRPL